MKRNLELRAAIVRLFDTQAVFAEALGKGWDDARISRIINGREVLSRPDQEMFATTLRVPREQIFPSNGSEDQS